MHYVIENMPNYVKYTITDNVEYHLLVLLLVYINLLHISHLKTACHPFSQIRSLVRCFQ